MIGLGWALQASGTGAPPLEAPGVPAMVAFISFDTQYPFRLRAQGKCCKILTSYSQANEAVESRESMVEGQAAGEGRGSRVKGRFKELILRS